jgi:hypothetical protein
MAGGLVLALCKWSEAAARYQKRRAAADQAATEPPTEQATVTQLPAKSSRRAS